MVRIWNLTVCNSSPNSLWVSCTITSRRGRNVDLRLATLADVDQIKALIVAAYTPWVEVIGAIPAPMKDDYARAIAQGLVQVLVGAREIEAVLVLIPLPDAMLIDNVAVAPEAQGRGHAKRLLTAANGAAATEGYKTLRLYTHEKMASNIGFYHRNGFGITKRITEHGLNRVYMEKSVIYPEPS